MELNVITRSWRPKVKYGSAKVLANTLDGLTAAGVKVSINGDISRHAINWVHDSMEGLIEAGFSKRPVLLGPNIAVAPNDLPKLRPKLHKDSIYLFPSLWPLRAWEAEGFSECRCEIWACGVDLDRFTVKRRAREGAHLLVYFKNREESILSSVLKELDDQKISYEVIRYGEYTEEQYLRSLGEATASIWVSGTESQGFAQIEALASGLPMMVINARSLIDNSLHESERTFESFTKRFIEVGASSAPYFSPACGELVEFHEFEGERIRQFLGRCHEYHPSQYIESIFSIDKCTQRLLQLASELYNPAQGNKRSYKIESKILRYLDLASRKWAWIVMANKITSAFK